MRKPILAFLETADAMRAELTEIEAKLADLDATRERSRMERGNKVLELTRASDPGIERAVKALTDQLRGLDETLVTLRARRRELTGRLKPMTPVAAQLVEVRQAPGLTKAQADLDAARDALQTYERNAHKGDDKATAVKARLQVLRAKADDAKAVRDALLPAHRLALTEALRPIVLRAAEELLAASQAFTAARLMLCEAAGLAPNAVGAGGALAHMSGLDGRAAFTGEALARDLLMRWADPEILGVAAE